MANDPNLTQLFLDGRNFSGMNEAQRQAAVAALLSNGARSVERQYVVTNSSTSVPKKLTQVSVTSITRTLDTATVTTTTSHYLVTGDTVVISGATQTDYNGTFIVTVTSATTFTYTVIGRPATPATGTILSTADLPFVCASLMGFKSPQTQNTGLVYFGVTSVDGEQPYQVMPTGVYVLNVVTTRNLSLNNYYLDVQTANDGLVISFYP